MSEPFAVSTPIRSVLGAIFVVLAVAGILVGVRLDWGMAWIVIVPALALLVPGVAMVERRRLHCDGRVVTIETGALRPRRLELPLAGSELELLPTAGATAVVLHMPDRELALATWMTRSRAEALLAWLDATAPDGAWPRRDRSAAHWDT